MKSRVEVIGETSWIGLRRGSEERQPEQTATARNSMEDGKGDRLEYDEEGQLTHAAYRAQSPEGGATPAARAENFDYDKMGNRKQWNDIASGGHTWMTRRNNKLNQYSQWENNIPYPNPQHWGSRISHDDNVPTETPTPTAWPWHSPGNGVTMEDGYITASFNALNQPIAVWTPVYPTEFVWFGYDPLGRCVKRWIGSEDENAANTDPATYYYYDGWNLVQDVTTPTPVTSTYIHGGRVDEIVFSKVNGVWQYHHYDARGHCIMLKDANGVVVQQYEYDAFGHPYVFDRYANLLLRSSAKTRFLFTGREYLSALRTYDFRNRMYQPELGRFLQPDPKQFEAGDYNLYRYCHNDPVNKSDPFGLYARGEGFTDEQWKKFDTAQQAAASRLEKASAKMDAKAFEKAFGKGSATAENMARVQKTMQGMATALRDDGSKGYVANAFSNPKSSTLGTGNVNGNKISINVGHPGFGVPGTLRQTVGHESGHNLGLDHARGDAAAYKYGNEAQREVYKNLPTAERLNNPDNYMEFAR